MVQLNAECDRLTHEIRDAVEAFAVQRRRTQMAEDALSRAARDAAMEGQGLQARLAELEASLTVTSNCTSA